MENVLAVITAIRIPGEAGLTTNQKRYLGFVSIKAEIQFPS